ncbi:hypothetical protein [Mesorhizobium sp. LjRoot246]|uniref:hypothetical protein n=1 Tax=Mesorhizobium sp. LjRoot246 TaxID=3342294 RepID=UPI003ECEF384
MISLSCPSVDFGSGSTGLASIGRAKRGFDDAGALADLVHLGLPLETAGWRLGRGHHADGSR